MNSKLKMFVIPSRFKINVYGLNIKKKDITIPRTLDSLKYLEKIYANGPNSISGKSYVELRQK